MLLRHAGERGVAIDHWAALITEGDDYRVWAIEGESGSLLPDGGLTADGTGSPAIWTKDVVDGKLKVVLAPSTGKLADLLRPATEIVQDPRIDVLRKINPDDTA
jgi:dipeptidase E